MPRLNERVDEYVKSCDVCQRYKRDRHPPMWLIERIHLPEEKWQSVSMDWITLPPVVADGMKYDEVLTVTDRASKMVHLLATRSETSASQIAEQFLKEVVRLHGLPTSVISDRDSVFTSAFWEELTAQLGMKNCPSTPFHPQANGQAERTNQTVKQTLRTLHATRQAVPWVKLLPLVEIAINNAPIANTEFSPYYLNSGSHPIFHFDVLPDTSQTVSLEPVARFVQRLHADWIAVQQALDANWERANTYVNRKRTDYTFQFGQLVLVCQQRYWRSQLGGRGPLDAINAGPYRIDKVVRPGTTYRLDIPPAVRGRMRPVFHANELIPFETHAVDPAAALPPPPMTEDDYAVLEADLRAELAEQASQGLEAELAAPSAVSDGAQHSGSHLDEEGFADAISVHSNSSDDPSLMEVASSRADSPAILPAEAYDPSFTELLEEARSLPLPEFDAADELSSIAPPAVDDARDDARGDSTSTQHPGSPAAAIPEHVHRWLDVLRAPPIAEQLNVSDVIAQARSSADASGLHMLTTSKHSGKRVTFCEAVQVYAEAPRSPESGGSSTLVGERNSPEIGTTGKQSAGCPCCAKRAPLWQVEDPLPKQETHAGPPLPLCF